MSDRIKMMRGYSLWGQQNFGGRIEVDPTFFKKKVDQLDWRHAHSANLDQNHIIKSKFRSSNRATPESGYLCHSPMMSMSTFIH